MNDTPFGMGPNGPVMGPTGIMNTEEAKSLHRAIRHNQEIVATWNNLSWRRRRGHALLLIAFIAASVFVGAMSSWPWGVLFFSFQVFVLASVVTPTPKDYAALEEMKKERP